MTGLNRFVFAVFGSLIFATLVVGQEEKPAIQTTSRDLVPQFNAAQRLELARQIIEPLRQAAMADPMSDVRTRVFTQHMAAIDPVWTAKYLLDNPLPDTGRLYDNSALLQLAARPELIDEEVLFQLLEREKYFTFHQYIATALKNLPADRTELRNRLIQLGQRPPSKQASLFYSMSYMLEIASLSGDPTALENVQKQIDEFYESGDAETFLSDLEKQPRVDAGYRNHVSALLYKYAPVSHRGKFDEPSVGTLFSFIRDNTLTRDQKLAFLHQIADPDFGETPYEHMTSAGAMGLVALYDLDLAMKWANQLPLPVAVVLARLAIAPTIARDDPAKARVLIRDCYFRLSNMKSTNKFQSDTFPAAAIANSGLPVVAFVDSSLLDECIDRTIDATNPLKTSMSSDAKKHRFHVVAMVARYDRAKAQKLFDEIQDEVSLHDSADFFRALVALHPDQVLEEYRSLPPPDKNGTDWKIHVRNAILPALTTTDDTQFQDALTQQHYLTLDPSIFEAFKADKN